MSDGDREKPEESDCIVPSRAIPAEELGRYSVERDPHREKDVADYVESQARATKPSNTSSVLRKKSFLGLPTRSGM